MAAILLYLMEVERSKLFKYLNLKKNVKRPDTSQHGSEYIYNCKDTAGFQKLSG